jgi:arginine/lysine/ornithine decarboxylase
MAMFGSTSPSYLTLASLDLCNRYLADGYRDHLREMCGHLEEARKALAAAGWLVEPSDPLRLTVRDPAGMTGGALADRLRENGVECEYADPDVLVLMLTPENRAADIERLLHAFGTNDAVYAPQPSLPLARGERVCSVREALFAPRETVPAAQSLGRVCGAPTVGCPPAIPIAVSGERIGPEALELFRRYGVEQVEVLR